MNTALRSLRGVLGLGLTWAILWAAFATAIGVIIGVVDPDSIDPGESPMIVGAIMRLVRLVAGVAFGILLSLFERDRAIVDLSPSRTILWGILGSVPVSAAHALLGCLAEGDAILAARIQMGTFFCAVGGVLAPLSVVIARRWVRWRSTPTQPR